MEGDAPAGNGAVVFSFVFLFPNFHSDRAIGGRPLALHARDRVYDLLIVVDGGRGALMSLTRWGGTVRSRRLQTQKKSAQRTFSIKVNNSRSRTMMA